MLASITGFHQWVPNLDMSDARNRHSLGGQGEAEQNVTGMSSTTLLIVVIIIPKDCLEHVF